MVHTRHPGTGPGFFFRNASCVLRELFGIRYFIYSLGRIIGGGRGDGISAWRFYWIDPLGIRESVDR